MIFDCYVLILKKEQLFLFFQIKTQTTISLKPEEDSH